MKKLTIAGQLSTVHSSDESLQIPFVNSIIGKLFEAVPLDILIVGWEEKQDLFNHLTSEKRPAKEVYLWYPFLSDYPGLISQHLVINYQSNKSKGWDGYKGTGIKESFKQSCPNNPSAVSTSLMNLERILKLYPFDGVFIDKIRFPSIANGLSDVFTCFCPHCHAKANEVGLDLTEVKHALENRKKSKPLDDCPVIQSGSMWLDHLIADYPILQQFIRFRMDSINQVVDEIHRLVTRLNKKMSLDVFSPCLAPLVGQDFAYLAVQAEWVKPMIYRFGNGPSSLRSEIPALIYELGNYKDISLDRATTLITTHIDGLQGVPLKEIEKIAPLSLIQSETNLAVKLLSDTAVYLGLETVNIPGKMDIKPGDIEEILKIGNSAGVDGYVLSWDLLHTPPENVAPLQTLL